MPSWRRGGNKRDAGAEMEKNDNEANGTQEEVTLQSLMEFAISMHEKLETALEGLANDPEREEGRSCKGTMKTVKIICWSSQVDWKQG